MNKEIFDILESITGFEDTFKWAKCVINLDERLCNIENAIEKIIENLERVINILENLHIVPKRGE